jgi:hypothetical protein
LAGLSLKSLLNLRRNPSRKRTSRRTPQSAGSAELPTGVCRHRHQVVAGRHFTDLFSPLVYGCSGFLLSLRLLALERRWLSPLISMMWQWCTSRSTAATVIELLGKISSQAMNGWFPVISTERRS